MRWLRRLLVAAALALGATPAPAQQVTVIGPVTPGHCTNFFSTTQIQDAGAACGTGGGGVSSVSNSDSTLTFSPTTGAVVGSLNLGHANTWSATQGFAGITATSITDSALASAGTQCVQASSTGVLSVTGSACGSGSGAVNSVSNADGTLTISPTTGVVVASLALGHANTWTAVQTFTNSDLALLGSSTGATTFTSANAGASNFTITFPAATGTVALTSGVATSVSNADGTLTISPTTGAVVASLALGHANTWTAGQSFTNADLIMLGSTSGSTTLEASATAGATVATFPANTGTVAELNLAQTWSATQTFAAISASSITDTGITGSTQCVQANSSGVLSGAGAACGSGGAVTSVSNADGTLTISPTTGAVVASLALGHANTWTAVQTFSNGDLSLAGSTSGNTLLEASAVAGSGTIATFPNNTGTVAETNFAQTFSAAQTFSSTLNFSGLSTGTQVSCLGLNSSNGVVLMTGACGVATVGGGTPPTTQKFLSGSGTYTTPAGVQYIVVELIGGGGGGSGAGTTGGGTGGNGGDTCWNTTGAACTSPVYDAGGGPGGVWDGVSPVNGGVISGSGTCSTGVAGGQGGVVVFASGGTANDTGANGGSSALGGNGAGADDAVGGNGAANTGGGGGGGGATGVSTSLAGNGGGAGAYCRIVIPTPAGTYTYAVGAAGTAGAAGTTGGFAGGTGGSGGIWVTEVYPGAGTAGGSNTQVQYNASGVLAGIAGATSNGTILTVATNDFALAGSTSGTTLLNATAAASGTATLPANTGIIAELNLAQTWSAAQTFNNADLIMAGSTSGTTTLEANATAGSTVATFPANTGIVAELNLAQTWSAAQTFNANDLITAGSTSGTLTLACVATCGSRTATFPANTGTVAELNLAQTWTAVQTITNSDLALLGSSTGATTFTSANASATNYTATVPANTGTLAELNLAQTWSAAQTFNASDLLVSGSTSGTLTLNCVATCGSVTATFPSNTGTVAELNLAQTWTAAQTFTNSDLLLLGSSTGATTFTSANASATAYTATVPANTGTIAELNLAQTWTNPQTFNNNDLVLAGATSGTTTLIATAVAGSTTATFPANTGTVAETNLAQTFSAGQTFSSTLTFSGLSTGTQVSCLGLTSGNAVALSTGACGSGGGGTPGGATNSVQYNNSGSFGGFGIYTSGTHTLQLDAADAATANAQNLIVQNVSAGTANGSGALWTHQGSLSTGGGFPGNINFSTGGQGEASGGAVTSISNASPAVVTLTNHGFIAGEPVYFTTTGTLPTGLSTLTTYWVSASPAVTANTFSVQSSFQGSNVNTSSAGSGTHTVIGGGVVTISIASPAVISFTAHMMSVGQPVQFATTGALPTGITAATTYYVIAAGFTNGQFEISATPNGSAINTSGTQSGTQTVQTQGTAQNAASPVVTIGPSTQTVANAAGFNNGAPALTVTGAMNNPFDGTHNPTFLLYNLNAQLNNNAATYLFAYYVNGQKVIFSDFAQGTSQPELIVAGNITTQNGGFSGSGASWTFNGSAGINLANYNYMSFGNGTPGNQDTSLFRDATAGVLALGDFTSKTTATGLRVYNTTDNVASNTAPTNYERAAFDWTTNSNSLTIATQHGGTGSARSIIFDTTAGTNQIQIDTSGNLIGSNWKLQNGGITFSAQAGFKTVASNVVSFTDTFLTADAGWLQWAGQASLDADFSATSNTTLANVTGTSDNLSLSLLAGRTYNFTIELFMTTTASAGGIKIGLGGTATITNLIADGVCVDGTTEVAVTRISTLTQLVANTNAGTTPKCRLMGTFTVNAAGTLTVQFAQNASSASASTVKRGSYMQANDVKQ